MNDDILTATDGRPYERLRLAVAARLLSGALHDAPPAAASTKEDCAATIDWQQSWEQRATTRRAS